MNEKLLKQLKMLFDAEYKALYNGEKYSSSEQVKRFDEMSANNKGFQKIITAFAHYRHDLIMSDREANAFMNVFDYIMTA